MRFRLYDEGSRTSHVQDVWGVPVRHGIDEHLKNTHAESVVVACFTVYSTLDNTVGTPNVGDTHENLKQIS